MDETTDTVGSLKDVPINNEPKLRHNPRRRFQRLKTWFLSDPSSNVNNEVIDPKYNYQAFNTLNYIYLLGGRFRFLKFKNRQNSSTEDNIELQGFYVFGMLFLMIFPLTLFFVFEAKWCWYNISPAVVILLAYFTLLLLQNFIYAAFSDPGVLPRNVHLVDNLVRDGLPQEYYSIMTLPGPVKKNGKYTAVDIKYCSTCNIWRPPRAFHCSRCNCCISSHDHHCIWLNNCIGQRNYWYFINTVLFTVVCCCFVMGLCFHRIRVESFESKNSVGLDISLFLGIYAALILILPLLLLFAHIMVGFVGLNSREFLNMDKRNPDINGFKRFSWFIKEMKDKSIFDKGNIFSNMRMEWFRNRGVSDLPLRDRYVTGDTRFMSYTVGSLE